MLHPGLYVLPVQLLTCTAGLLDKAGGVTSGFPRGHSLV
jgi:hypothetical protein